MREQVIQGGMGLGLSVPLLARAVSTRTGPPWGLGTVSGTAVNVVMARVLQNGSRDKGCEGFLRALEEFPFPDVAKSVIDTWYVSSGIPKGKRYRTVEMFTLEPSPELINLTVCANFAIVWLAKEGHHNRVSINYLEKVNMPLIYSFVGAMLAGVDYVTMGAGIPTQVPGVLDTITQGRPAEYRIPIGGGDGKSRLMNFDPVEHFGTRLPEMNRPAFLPIVSLHTLAKMFLRRASGSVEGFIVEAPSAGGHNAPPRVRGEDPRAEPIYGPKDEVDFGEMVDLGLPFWIGGSFASPEGLKRAQTLGATGIQAGSIFALCEESGMDDSIKREVRRLGFRGELRVHTNPIASPTGFPFKVVNLGGTLSDEGVYESRRRTCDVSGLVTPHVRHDGEIEYRCPAEPVKHYGRKGGVVEDTQEVRCLCNGLLTTAALGNPGEPAIVTLGDDVSFLRRLMTKENDSYSASDALTYLLGVGHA